jgi:hypothetical protein
MVQSLCCHYPCPHICERVCHCSAGIARAQWLAACQRYDKEVSKTRGYPRRPVPPGVNPETGEITTGPSRMEKATGAILTELVGQPKVSISSHPYVYGQSSLGFYRYFLPSGTLQRKGLVVALILAVILTALFAYGYQHTDHYEPITAPVGVSVNHTANQWNGYYEGR